MGLESLRLYGQVAVITGAGRGVGLAALYPCAKDCYSTGDVVHFDGGIQDTNLP